MDSYVTYLQITNAESSKVSLLQLPPSPHVSPFSPLWMLFAANTGVGGPGGTSAFILGVGACCPLPGGRSLHAIK